MAGSEIIANIKQRFPDFCALVCPASAGFRPARRPSTLRGIQRRVDRFAGHDPVPVARTLDSIARRVRGEDVAWEDEWEGADPRSAGATPEVRLCQERAVKTVSASTSAKRQSGSPPPLTPRAKPAPAVTTQYELFLEDAVADSAAVASPPAAPSVLERIHARAAVPTAEEPMTVLPLPAPAALSAPPEPARLLAAGGAPKRVKPISNPA